MLFDGRYEPLLEKGRYAPGASSELDALPTSLGYDLERRTDHIGSDTQRHQRPSSSTFRREGRDFADFHASRSQTIDQ